MDKIEFSKKRYWDVFLQSFKISFREIVEYKASFISAIIIAFFWNAAYLLFGYVLVDQFGDLIGWSFIDYILFVYVVSLVNDNSGLFWFSKSLSWTITEGNFNTFLFRPGNPFLIYYANIEFNGAALVLIDGLFFIPFIWYFGSYSLFNILIMTMFILLLIILLAFAFAFFNSFSFYFLKLGKSLGDNYEYFNKFLRSYPGSYFIKTPILYFMYISPIFFASTLLIPIAKFGFSSDLIYYVLIILILLFIFIMGCIINWHYGLKGYEAYG